MATINEIRVNLLEESHYQKFRYPTEKRTGKKQHEKPMMDITFPTTTDVIELFIYCVNADQPHILHPNTLLGLNCKNGCFRLDNIPADKRIKIQDNKLKFSVPYLYIVRTKKEDKLKAIKKTINSWPKYKDEFCQHTDVELIKDLRTDQVRLKVVLTINDVKLQAVTNRITHHDAGEKVKLNITELTRNVFSNDADEAERTIHVFTEDTNGPDIKPDDFVISVETENWNSQPKPLSESDINYKRVVKYTVPVCGDHAISDNDVKGHIVLKCLTNELTCKREISYTQCALNRKRKRLNECDQRTKLVCNGQTRGNTDAINAAPVPVIETDTGNLLPNTPDKIFTNTEDNNLQFMGNPEQYQVTEASYGSENMNSIICQNETEQMTYLTNKGGPSFHDHVNSQETETTAFSSATIVQPQESMESVESVLYAGTIDFTTQVIAQSENLINDSQYNISLCQNSDNIKGNNSTEKIVDVSPLKDDDEKNEKNPIELDSNFNIPTIDMSSVDLVKFCPDLL